MVRLRAIKFKWLRQALLPCVHIVEEGSQLLIRGVLKTSWGVDRFQDASDEDR